MADFEVKDMALAVQGKLNIEYAERNMPIMLMIRERFAKEQPFRGLMIGMALHVTKETAVLVRTLRAGGAQVAIAGCNPLSTQDDVAAALAQEGVAVFAKKGETKEEYYKYIEEVIGRNPDLTIDDGCDLISALHTKHADKLGKLIGGCEETTTGVIRLRAMEADKALKSPIVAVNDNKTKHLLDNYYGTGQSTIDGILRATNTLIAGKVFVVAGYGDCGKGVALRAKGMGAHVIVTEVDAFCALQATLDGYQVMPMEKAAPMGDIFLTVTGDKDVVTLDHVKKMKDGAILANSGHFDCEVDVASLNRSFKRRRVRPFLDEYEVGGGRKVFVCGEGRLINLAAAEGHPSEVMATSFAGQSLACEFLVKNKGKLKCGVVTLPPEIDQTIAELQLKAMGVAIDTLTEEQKRYLSSWQEGT